jgi:hypothetical protein
VGVSCTPQNILSDRFSPGLDGLQEAPSSQFKREFRLYHQEADDGARTRDTWLGKPVLYRLSYVRVPRILAALPESASESDAEFKAGDLMWRDAEEHATDNIGETEVYALFFEPK